MIIIILIDNGIN